MINSTVDISDYTSIGSNEMMYSEWLIRMPVEGSSHVLISASSGICLNRLRKTTIDIIQYPNGGSNRSPREHKLETLPNEAIW
jgi:hypothetical protein